MQLDNAAMANPAISARTHRNFMPMLLPQRKGLELHRNHHSRRGLGQVATNEAPVRQLNLELKRECTTGLNAKPAERKFKNFLPSNPGA
jgi:hypothetical protein